MGGRQKAVLYFWHCRFWHADMMLAGNVLLLLRNVVHLDIYGRVAVVDGDFPHPKVQQYKRV
jgi:hypothetical protein